MPKNVPEVFDSPSRHRAGFDKLEIEDGERRPGLGDKLRRFFKRRPKKPEDEAGPGCRPAGRT